MAKTGWSFIFNIPTHTSLKSSHMMKLPVISDHSFLQSTEFEPSQGNFRLFRISTFLQNFAKFDTGRWLVIPWATWLMMQLARHLLFTVKIIEINELSIDLDQLMDIVWLTNITIDGYLDSIIYCERWLCSLLYISSSVIHKINNPKSSQFI